MIKTLLTVILVILAVYILLPSFSVSIRFGANNTETPFEKKMKTFCGIKKMKKTVDNLPVIA